MKARRRLLVVLAALVLVYTLVGFFLLPPLLRSQLATRLSGALGRPVTVGQVSLNPFALSCTVRKVLVREKTGEAFFSLEELYVNFQSASLWKRGLVVGEVRLSKPYARVVRKEAGVYNFSNLLHAKEQPENKSKGDGGPFRFAVGNLQVVQGSADFLDAPRGTQHTLRGLDLTVPFLSNFPAFLETFVEPRFQVTLDGHAFSARGDSKPFAQSLETSATLELKDFEIPKYVEYLPFKVAATLKSARLDLKTHVRYVQYRDRGPTLTLNGDVALHDVALDDPQGNPLLRLPLGSAAFGPVDAFARSARVKAFRLEGIELQTARNAKGQWNWSTLVPRDVSPAAPPASGAPAPQSASSPFSYQVDAVDVTRAKLSFEDGSRAKPFRTVVSPLELSIRNLTNGAGQLGDFTLSLATEAAEALDIKGSLGLAPLQSTGTLRLVGLRLANYAPYYDKQLLLALKGSLDLASRYRYGAGHENPDLQLSALSLVLSALEARRPEEAAPVFATPAFQVRDAEFDLSKKNLFLGRVTGDKGTLNLVRLAGDPWNVAQLAPAPRLDEPSRAGATGAQKNRPPKTDEVPWTVTVGNLQLKNFGVRVTDHEPEHTARVAFSNIAVDASNLSTAPRSQGKLAASASLNKTGTLSAKGTVSLSPVAAKLVLALKGTEIAPFQPYFTEKLKVFVTDGAVSADGVLTLGGGTHAAKSLPVTFSGDVLVSALSVNDKNGVEEIARFGSLAAQGIDVRTDPLAVKIAGIALTDFSGAVAIEQDGRLNLLDLVGSAPDPAPGPPGPTRAAAPPPAQQASAPRIDVKTVTLQGGRVRFTDRHVKPVYSSTLDDLGGRLSGLTSQEGILADVDFRARLNGYAPLEITGRVNPLQKDPYVDLKAAVKGMDLSAATPYSGKYLGYTIQQGKLFLDVRYRIDKRRIDSQNVILLDRLTLGDKVESPEATKIPVRFGLALLTDRNGQVHVDVPIDGSLDDPKFHLGKVVWDVVLNLLAKAATSPFSLLGSLFGGGEELGFVAFTPGETTLGPPSLKKIDALAKALHDRPALRLEVLGRTDPEKDLDALKERLYARKLKVQKAKERLTGGESVEAVDALAISQEELPKYLTRAYKAEKFPKPKNALGLEKDLPPGEMEKLLRSHLAVGEDDLRLLAAHRAEAVREAFAKTSLVEPDRIFLVEGDKKPQDPTSKAPASRVEFALK